MLLHRFAGVRTPFCRIVQKTYGTMTAAVPKWSPTFIPIQSPEQPEVSSSSPLVRIVSYNILAQSYVKSISFPHSPSPCLRWKNRSKAVLERLLSFDADVLCLQELDEYESYYRSRLTREGYSSVYIQRSGRKRDGCGIFFKRNRMELVEEQAIDFNDLVPPPTEVDTPELSSEDDPQTPDVSAPVKDSRPERSKSRSRSSSPTKAGPEVRGDPNDPRVRLKRDCVAILAAFRMLEAPNKCLILGNTHLYWDPEWADVKLAQARYLLLQTVRFQNNLSAKLDSNPLVFVCGDYNSTPGDQVYRYITSGFQESGAQQNGTLQGIVDESLESKFTELGLEEPSPERAPLHLTSLYEKALGEHPNTNVTPGFTGTLDYVFFRPSDSLRIVNLLALPDQGSPELEGGLPNHSHPSDHLPIGADFAVQ
ncbi:hypothetical protein M758_11G019300 [Ceratodon purpureus]|nr:hypothetical protein M758_11G019300 [Ceratodon purpureus]